MFLSTIFKNTTFQFVSRLITSSSSFIILLMVGSLFGTLGYGSLTKIIAIVSLFYLVVDFGFNPFYLQEENTSLQFRTLLYSRLLIAGVITFSLVLFALFVPGNIFSLQERGGIVLFSMMLFANAIAYSSTALFQKRLSYQTLTIAQLSGSSIALVVAAVLFLVRAPLLFFLGAIVVGGLLSALLSLVATKEKIRPVHIQFVFTKTLIRKSLPYFLMLFINMLYFSIDTILLSFYTSTQSVGIYGLSYQVFEFLIALPLFLSNSIYPILLSLQKNNRMAKSYMLRYAGIYLGAAVVVMILAWILSPLVVLVRADFSASILPLRILLVSLPFFFLTSFLQWLLITKNHQMFLLWVYFGSLILNIVLNIVFIPQYSYVASAVITGIGEVLVFLVLAVKILRTPKFFDNGN